MKLYAPVSYAQATSKQVHVISRDSSSCDTDVYYDDVIENGAHAHQQVQGPKTPRPITVHFKKSPSSSVLEVGMWYLL